MFMIGIIKQVIPCVRLVKMIHESKKDPVKILEEYTTYLLLIPVIISH